MICWVSCNRCNVYCQHTSFSAEMSITTLIWAFCIFEILWLILIYSSKWLWRKVEPSVTQMRTSVCLMCLQLRLWRPHRSQQWPATRPAPRTPSVAFWVSAQLLMWARGRGTKVSTTMSFCVSDCFCISLHIVAFLSVNCVFSNMHLFCAYQYTTFTMTDSLNIHSSPRQYWKPRWRELSMRINDRCVCVISATNQTSSFRNPLC